MAPKPLAALFAFAAAALLPLFLLAHDYTPKHGGLALEVNGIDYELVATADRIRLYLSDHGKAVDLGKVAARLTLLTGSEKQEVELKPAGDKLEASGMFKVAKGTKVTADVSRGGKAVTVRFVVK